MSGGKKGVLRIADNKDHLSSADSIINPSVNASRVKHGNLHVSYNYSQDRRTDRRFALQVKHLLDLRTKAADFRLIMAEIHFESSRLSKCAVL